tara:strand:- start:3057 stop:3305 length:249 start_codon:yes stop_codon:yes gene_type:complete
MGRMKEKFMEQMENEYRGSHDAFIHGLAQVTCEELVPDVDHVCPNCFDKSRLHSMVRNEKEAECLDCGQAYIIVDDNVLRFK